MPHTLTKKNFRSKLRSCKMCKPNKMHWDDSRDIPRIKADQKFVSELQDL